MIRPILSIISVTYENPEELDATLQSVHLHYREGQIEQIVIDGSRDRSCQRVAESHSCVDRVVFERDDGRYDAMNKGIKNSRGIYLLFLNSGDRLVANCNIDQVLSTLEKSAGRKLFYGDSLKKVGSFTFYFKAPRLPSGEKVKPASLLPCHQAVFFPRQFFIKNMYDTTMKISADTKVILRACKTLQTENLQETISIFELGGVSNNWSSYSDVIEHWRESRDARNISSIAHMPKLVKNVIKYSVIKCVGHELYYCARLKTEEVLGK